MKNKIAYIAMAALGGLLAGFLIFAPGGDSPSESDPHVHQQVGDSQMWTCSMHPQVVRPEPGDCPICGMDLIPADNGGGQTGARSFRMTENAMALANVQTIRVSSADSSDSRDIVLSGKIVENADANAIQASFFDGRIETLDIDYEGQQIKRGQLLATIYAPELIAAQQELITAVPLKEEQPALYRAVRNKLKNWKLPEAQIEEIESSGRVKEFFPIYATVSGTVAELITSEGDYIKAGQPIARLSNLETVWADFDAYEQQLNAFRVGQPIRIVSKAYPDQAFNTRITFIDPILNESTRTVTVRATLPNRDGLLKPGMFVEGYVSAGIGSGKSGPLSVPASAVLWTGERSLVYVKSIPGEPVFEVRQVELGTRIGDRYQVLSGLSQGDEVVVNGTFTVDAAAQLQGKKSMMNPEGGVSPGGYQGQGTGNPGAASREYPEEVKAGYGDILSHYLFLKDGLVLSRPEQAEGAARKMMGLLPELSGTGESWIDSRREALDFHLQKLLNAAGDLQRQRAEFLHLSEVMIELGRNLGATDDPVYVQFCPMADNNKGAYWLSGESEIRNPYFGDAMLRCGEVRETWGEPSGS